MPNETITVRGAEAQLQRFHGDLQEFLAEQKIAPSQLSPTAPAPVKRRLTDRAPLGHEALLEIAIEIGKAVAIGALSSVLKELVVGWIKEQAKKRGLLAETKEK